MPRIELRSSAPVLGLAPDDELETPLLPGEHPKWVRDALAASQRARTLLARIKPVVVRVLTFWDHHLRSTTISGRRLTIDVSGSYRVE